MRFELLLDLALLALLVYCLIDCIQTDSSVIRNLPKPLWVVLIVLIPLVGGVAWLVAGRPERGVAGPGRPTRPPVRGRPGPQRPPAPLGPDDDPDFLRQMRAIDAEHERTLEQWERDLRDRERRLRGGDGDPPADGAPPPDGSTPSGGPR
jgi:hypothetical protein